MPELQRGRPAGPCAGNVQRLDCTLCGERASMDQCDIWCTATLMIGSAVRVLPTLLHSVPTR
jgi:hypothetical protein